MKICPVMSSLEKQIPCTKDCAWYCDDGIPSRCMVKDISWTLSRIEKQLEDIYIALPDEEN